MTTLSSRTRQQERDTLTPAQAKLVSTTCDKIARELLIWLSPKEANTIATMKRHELIKLHHTLGRDIRNEYELWMPEHDITSMYHAAEQAIPMASLDGPSEHRMALDDGRTVVVYGAQPDCHPCHPDAFSNAVIERLWELLPEKLGVRRV
jgi:hypothetical protein